MSPRRGPLRFCAVVLLACALPCACAAQPPPAPAAFPDWSFLPPPPAPGSAAQRADDEAYEKAKRLRGTPRWGWAIQDADGSFPGVALRFACAAALPIGPQAMPELYQLLLRTFSETAGASHAAKAAFDRRRPFVADGAPICTPQLAQQFRTDSAYPSAAAASGWAMALVLAELVPERTQELMRRGYAFGESREVCGVHWHSDVAAGRLIGSAVLAQLHGRTDFAAQVAAARREVGAARAVGAGTTADCAAEARALGWN